MWCTFVSGTETLAMVTKESGTKNCRGTRACFRRKVSKEAAEAAAQNATTFQSSDGSDQTCWTASLAQTGYLSRLGGVGAVVVSSRIVRSLGLIQACVRPGSKPDAECTSDQ